MKKTIRIGLDCISPADNTLSEAIAPEYKFDNGLVAVVVFSPIVNIDPFSPMGYVSNVDVLVTGGRLDPRLRQLMGDRVIDISRLEKTDAMVKLFLAAKGTGIETLLPLRWNGCLINQFESNVIPAWVKRCVVKEEGGGSGTPQAIIPLDLVETFVTEHSDYPQTELEETFPDCVFFFDNEKPDPDKTGLMQESWAVYPYVEDLDKEFRIIRAGHMRVMYERERHTDKGISRVKVSGKHRATTDMFNDTYHLEENGKVTLSPALGWGEMFVEINRLFDRLGFEWGSVDVYTRTDHNGKVVVGIFEYCPQFGTRLMRHALKRDLAKAFVETIANRFVDEMLPRPKSRKKG